MEKVALAFSEKELIICLKNVKEVKFLVRQSLSQMPIKGLIMFVHIQDTTELQRSVTQQWSYLIMITGDTLSTFITLFLQLWQEDEGAITCIKHMTHVWSCNYLCAEASLGDSVNPSIIASNHSLVQSGM